MFLVNNIGNNNKKKEKFLLFIINYVSNIFLFFKD